LRGDARAICWSGLGSRMGPRRGRRCVELGSLCRAGLAFFRLRSPSHTRRCVELGRLCRAGSAFFRLCSPSHTQTRCTTALVRLQRAPSETYSCSRSRPAKVRHASHTGVWPRAAGTCRERCKRGGSSHRKMLVKVAFGGKPVVAYLRCGRAGRVTAAQKHCVLSNPFGSKCRGHLAAKGAFSSVRAHMDLRPG